MQYLLLIYGPEDVWATMSEAEAGAVMDEYRAFTESIQAQGIMQSGAPLAATSTARTVRVRDGRATVSDGPQPGDRRDPPAAGRHRPRAHGRRGRPAGRAARSGRARRRAARPPLRLLSSGARGGGPGGPDAAHRRGADRGGDRPCLPDCT